MGYLWGFGTEKASRSLEGTYRRGRRRQFIGTVLEAGIPLRCVETGHVHSRGIMMFRSRMRFAMLFWYTVLPSQEHRLGSPNSGSTTFSSSQ
jgi:hypothetical protein